jgi:AraC-like DNA-binding protein
MCGATCGQRGDAYAGSSGNDVDKRVGKFSEPVQRDEPPDAPQGQVCRMHQELKFEQVEALDELYKDVGWDVDYRQLKPGPFRSHLRMRSVAGSIINHETYIGSLEIIGHNPEMINFVLFDQDGHNVSVNNIGVGDRPLIACTPGAQLDLFTGGRSSGYSLQFKIGLVQELADRLGLPDFFSRRADVMGVAVDPRFAVDFRQRAEALLVGAVEEDVVAAELNDLLSQLLCKLGSGPDSRGVGSDCGARASRRAFLVVRDYIDAHLTSPITLSDLCAVSGLTLRTLERLFIREVGLPPKRYIRALRLNRVRRTLAGADVPQGGSLAEIAGTHGLHHAGRFSLEYRAFFGESPRETRRRAAFRVAI